MYRNTMTPGANTANAATAAGDAWAHFLADVARTLTRYPEAHADVLAIFDKSGVKTE